MARRSWTISKVAGLYDDLMSVHRSEPPGYWDALMSGSNASSSIEDRRGQNDFAPKWENVPNSLRVMATHFGNQLWGTPQIPEAPDTPLGTALGKPDIRIVPQIDSRSPLDQAIDSVTDTISMFMPSGKKLGSDIPFTQRQFSPGINK